MTGGVFAASGSNLRLIDTSDNSVGGPFLTGGVVGTGAWMGTWAAIGLHRRL